MTASREDRAETAAPLLPTADSPTTPLPARPSGLCLSTSPNPAGSPSPTRRTVVAAVGAAGLAAALVACGSDDDKSSSEEPAGEASEKEEGGGGGGAVLARTADIPVGGGKIFKDENVVVTQPTKGEFKAFSNRSRDGNPPQGRKTRRGGAGTAARSGGPCHAPRSSSVVVTVATRARVFWTTAGVYSAGTPAMASAGTTAV